MSYTKTHTNMTFTIEKKISFKLSSDHFLFFFLKGLGEMHIFSPLVFDLDYCIKSNHSNEFNLKLNKLKTNKNNIKSNVSVKKTSKWHRIF